MKKCTLIFMAIALAALSFASGPQEKKAAGPYDAYCGEYTFDFSSIGAGIISAKVYIENGLLYMWADKSEPPDQLSPVEGKPTKFFIDDPDEGHWDIEFLKDEAGNWTKCRLINEGYGADVVGEKIKT